MTEETIKLLLEIDNHYELYNNVVLDKRVEVPAPPEGDYTDTDWSWDEIMPHTGVGHEDGDSWYFVKVLESSDKGIIPVGTEWEFGT